MFTARSRYCIIRYSRYDSGWVTEKLYFGSRLELENLVFSKSPRKALRPTHSPVQCMSGAIEPGFKRPRGSCCHAVAGLIKGGNLPLLPTYVMSCAGTISPFLNLSQIYKPFSSDLQHVICSATERSEFELFWR